MRSSEIEERFCERGQQKNAIIRSNMAEMGRQVTVVLYAVAMELSTGDSSGTMNTAARRNGK